MYDVRLHNVVVVLDMFLAVQASLLQLRAALVCCFSIQIRVLLVTILPLPAVGVVLVLC
jgi:ABC-type multidrug transport system fused ATPase/permease subunit